MSDYRGRYVWFELLTRDPEKAKAFYSRVVGWTPEAFPGPNDYTLWKNGAGSVGGLMEMPKEPAAAGVPPHWLAYIGTPDVDKTTAEARKAGAAVHVPPTDIPTVGRFSVLGGPGGLVFAAFTPAPGGPDRPQGPAAIGDCSWYEVVADDVDKTWSLMNGLFGWDKKGEAHDMGAMGFYQEYGTPGVAQPMGGIFKKPAGMPAPAHIQLYFRVEDVARAAEVVKANGGQVLNGPMEVPGGDFIVNCLDDQGAAFSLHHSNK